MDTEHLKAVKDLFLRSIKLTEEKYSHDKYKFYYSSMCGDLETLAIVEYRLDHDIAGFKERMKKSAEMILELMYGYDTGQSVSISYATMLVYKDLLSALASGDIAFAREFASNMFERGKGKSEAKIHIFDTKLGHSLKYLVLGQKKEAHEWIKKFSEECQKKGNASYQGLAKILKGILDENSALVQKGFDEFKKGYKMLIRRGGTAAHSEWLNTWGIGLANLAISRGLKLDINDEYIPKDLLIEPVK